ERRGNPRRPFASSQIGLGNRSGRSLVQPIARPELHTRDVHLRDHALVAEVVDRDAVVELRDLSGAAAAGCGLSRSAGAPRALDELVVDLFVLEQDHELVFLYARAEPNAAFTHVHVDRFGAALARRDSSAARARHDQTTFRRVEYRGPIRL